MLTPFEAQLANSDMDLYWQQVKEGRRADYVAGLLRERQSAQAREDEENMADIDVELARMGHEAAPPANRKGAAT